MGIPYQRHKPSAALRKFLDPLDPGSYFDCGRARLHGIDDVLLREAERRGRTPGDDTFQLVATDIGLIFCRPSISFAIAARWSEVTVARPIGGDSVVLSVVWPVHGELAFTVGKRLGGNVFRRWLQLQMQADREGTDVAFVEPPLEDSELANDRRGEAVKAENEPAVVGATDSSDPGKSSPAVAGKPVVEHPGLPTAIRVEPSPDSPGTDSIVEPRRSEADSAVSGGVESSGADRDSADSGGVEDSSGDRDSAVSGGVESSSGDRDSADSDSADSGGADRGGAENGGVEILSSSSQVEPDEVSSGTSSVTEQLEAVPVLKAESSKTIVWHEGKPVDLVQKFKLSDPELEAERLNLTPRSAPRKSSGKTSNELFKGGLAPDVRDDEVDNGDPLENHRMKQTNAAPVDTYSGDEPSLKTSEMDAVPSEPSDPSGTALVADEASPGPQGTSERNSNGPEMSERPPSDSGDPDSSSAESDEKDSGEKESSASPQPQPMSDSDEEGAERTSTKAVGLKRGNRPHANRQQGSRQQGSRQRGKVSLLELLASDESSDQLRHEDTLSIRSPQREPAARSIIGSDRTGDPQEKVSTDTEGLPTTVEDDGDRPEIGWLPPESIGNAAGPGHRRSQRTSKFVEAPIAIAMAVLIVGTSLALVVASRIGSSTQTAAALEQGTATTVDNQRFKTGFDESKVDEDTTSQIRPAGSAPASPRATAKQEQPERDRVEDDDSNSSATTATEPSSGSKARTDSVLCNSNYSGCVPDVSDVDCPNDGDGPAYLDEPVIVLGTDVYLLDTDEDGDACELDQPTSGGRRTP